MFDIAERPALSARTFGNTLHIAPVISATTVGGPAHRSTPKETHQWR
jgi:hypothetical protein